MTIKIPIQLQKEQLRFIPLDGKRPIEKDWVHNNHKYDDSLILNHIKYSGNYGVCTGTGNLLVIDVDNPTPEFMAKFYSKMPETFTVKTGKKGYHFYYFTEKPMQSRKIDAGSVHVDIQGIGKQVVGPNSIHPETGNVYEVIKNKEITFLPAYTLFEMFGEYVLKNNYSQQNQTDNEKLQDLLNKIIEKVNYEDRGSYYLISCPFHPPDTHPSFAIYKNTYLGYDFHDDSIHLLVDIAKKIGIQLRSESDKKIVVVEKFSPVHYAKPILEKYHFLLDKYLRFWRYDSDEGIWKEDAETWLKAYLRTNLFGDESQKSHYVKEVIDYIRDISYNPIDFKSPTNIIAFKNIAVDLNTGQRVQLKPEYYVTNKIPVVLDENIQDCPKIDKFFTEVMGEKNKIILYELVAYTLYRDYPYQKIFYLYGSGANGKSTFLDLLMTFIGEHNVASETPHDLIGSRFSAGNLFNKLANISSDISYELLKNPNKIKMLSGGDYINCERKYQNAFPFKNFAKLIFSTNMLPPTNDKSFAYYRRLYLIEFSKQFTGKNANKNLLAELTTPQELSGLAWKSIEILLQMKARGWSFTIDPEVEEVMEKYEKLSNPVHMFVEENCEDEIDSYIFVSTFYKDFQLWSKNKGLPILGNNEITRAMAELGYQKQRKGTDRHWAFVGLQWKRKNIEDFSSGEQQENKIEEIQVEDIKEIVKETINKYENLETVLMVLKQKGVNEIDFYKHLNQLMTQGEVFEYQPKKYKVIE